MQELYDAHGNCELNAKTDGAPLLTPAHIETWIQTYPDPDPDPDLDPFLHGKDAGGVDVIWYGERTWRTARWARGSRCWSRSSLSNGSVADSDLGCR